MSRSTKRFVFFRIYSFCSNIRLCFQLDAFVKEHVWPFKLQTRVSSSLIEYPIYKALCHTCTLTKASSWKHTHI